MLKELMSSRRFAPLFWAQFFSALNDNFLKNALVILILFGVGAGHGDALVTLAGATFIFPFFILSALGGELADKYVKADIAKRLKFAEIFAAGFAAAGFFLHSVPLLFIALATVRHHRRAVRPGEIRHPAGPADDRRARDRQRAGRRRDVPGDPVRHHRRRPVRHRLKPPGLRLDCRRCARDRVLAVGAHDPENQSRRRPISSSPAIR